MEDSAFAGSYDKREDRPPVCQGHEAFLPPRGKILKAGKPQAIDRRGRLSSFQLLCLQLLDGGADIGFPGEGLVYGGIVGRQVARAWCSAFAWSPTASQRMAR
jgi:hypothetical protein